MKFLWAAVVQNGSFYVNMKSLDEGSKSWHDLRLHHCCQYCDCDIQWTARIWASVSLQKTSSDCGQNSQHSYHRIPHFTAGTFTWEAAWQGATLTVTGGWLTCSPCVIMVTGDTPHHGQHHIMCSPLSTCVSLYNAITHITRGKVSRPQVGLGEDRWRTLGHVSAPRSDWELTVQVCDSVMFAAVPAQAGLWWPDSGRPHITAWAHSLEFISETGPGE